MTVSPIRREARATLVLLALSVFAAGPALGADELVVFTFSDGEPAAGLTVVLDAGAARETVGEDGSATFDLTPGAHSLQVLDGDESLYSFRFDSVRGQYVDAVVTLGAQNAHKLATYAPTESAGERRNAPTGNIEGTVALGGRGLADASVVVSQTGEVVQSDADGRFSLTLPRGVYDLIAYHPTDDRSRRETVRVVSGVTRGVVIGLRSTGELAIDAPDLGPEIEEVVVVASFDPNAFEASERDTNQIIDTLGIEQLSRFADTNVAASVVRVPSVTVQDNRFVFIRGLGDRYITTTLNGSTMPSTDPTKRTVPLDLFPSNFVNQLDIRKTFLAGMPGESTGGNLVINTRTFPNQRTGQVQVRVSATPGLTGGDVFTDPADGPYDYFGWDAGEREIPAAAAIADVLNLGTVEDPATGGTFEISDSVQRELQRAGALLISEDLDLALTTARPDTRIGANYGDVFDIGRSQLGVFAAFNFRNEWQQKTDGERNTYTPSGDQLDEFVFREYTNNVDMNGLISLGFNIGEHTFESNSLISRSTESRVVRNVGREGDEFQAQYRNTIDWVERQFLSQQFTGSHTLNAAGTLFADWQFTASQARRDAPDRRELTFSAADTATNPDDLIAGFDLDRLNDDQDVELNNFFIEPNAIVRRFDELVDANFDLAGNFSWDIFDIGSSFAKLSFGFQSIYRERDADSETYGFNINQQLVDNLITDNVLASEVITAESITGDPATGFAFQDKTLASDSYEADLLWNSVYLSYDHTFNDTFELVAGARYEQYDQTTNTFSLQGVQGPVESNIDEGSFLPSLGFNWYFTPTQQVRLAVSRTVARPDFKEAANATFYDTEFDFRVRGNPNLGISDILNVDARWEWYPNERDSLSFALFYKDFDNPIERVVQPASGTAGNSRTFENAESAQLYGAEIEARKEFLVSADYNRSFFFALNASVIESEVNLPDRSRPLQGQPRYTANLVLGFDHVALGQQVTLLLNQNGESIRDVGILGNPDVFEEPRLDVNLVYRWDIGENFSFRARLQNLLDDEVLFTQGGQTFLAYKLGRQIQIGADWSF